MKIVFLLSTFPKISETFILSQIAGLIDLGADIKIIAFKKADTKEIHPLVMKYQLLDKVSYLSSENKMIRGLRIGGAILHHPLVSNKLFNRKNHLVTGLRSLELLNQIDELADCQAVIAHYGPIGATVANLQAMNFVPDVKLITFFHGFDLTAFVKKNGTKAYRQLFAQDNKILPINQMFKDRLIELGANPNNVMVHHMGVNVDQFKYQTHKSHSPLRLLSVGRLVEKKGFDSAIEIVSKLINAGIDTRLTIIGDGLLKEQLQNQIAELHLEKQIILKGSQDQEQVKQQLLENDFFVLMSRTSTNGDKEGIPVVLMEAMAIGLPVISTIHSGIPELVTDAKSGWLVGEHDTQLAFNVIKNAYQEAEYTKLISNNARKKIEIEFNSEKLNQKLLQICFKEGVSYGE